jgi:hypothetical protein
VETVEAGVEQARDDGRCAPHTGTPSYHPRK